MARRRYLSTEISTDTRVNRLAIQAGDFAALLYTWMIPHAGDNAILPGDPEELLLIVCPGRRDKQPADIQDAVDAMVALGLMEHCANGELCFPESFFNHQTYITAKRRNPEADVPPNETPAQISANQRKTPHNSAEPRKTAQNAASFKSSLSSSLMSSSSVMSLVNGGSGVQVDSPPIKAVPPEHVSITHKRKKGSSLPDDFTLTPERRSYAEKIDIPATDVDSLFEQFRSYHQAHGTSMVDWHAAWQYWVRNSKAFAKRDATRFTKNGTKPVPRVSVFGDGDGGLARWKAEEEAKRHA